MNFDLLKRGEPDRVNAGVVSHDFFNVLGITPILGRTFVRTDDAPGADAVLILSYSYWQTQVRRRPGIVGQVFQMNDRPHTVVGVLPNVPHYPQENDVYMPVSACPFRAARRADASRRIAGISSADGFGRLKPGAHARRARRPTSRPSAAASCTTTPNDYRAGVRIHGDDAAGARRADAATRGRCC